jgi:cytochrome P450
MGELDSLAQEAVRRNGLASTAAEGRAELDVSAIRLFLHTGHDNSAPTLAWALWLLAVHPEWQGRVRDEWKDAGTRARIDPARYPRTSAVLRETLRLFPPIMQLSREIESELAVAGETLGPGFTAVLNLYAMHRSRLWWDAPDNFDPGRFLGSVEEGRHRLLWLPFGAGPRGCIGAMFAQVALILSLGRIVAAFELLPNPDEGLAATADWALRPQGRRPVFVRPLA